VAYDDSRDQGRGSTQHALSVSRSLGKKSGLKARLLYAVLDAGPEPIRRGEGALRYEGTAASTAARCNRYGGGAAPGLQA